MAWRWKDKQAGALALRYEPGNWGDALKGEWLLHWLRWWAASGRRSLSYRDPFCGQDDYPLTQPTRQRLEAAPLPLYRHWLEENRLRSSAALVQAECTRLGLELHSRRSDAESSPLAELGGSELLLFDPYDFFERWPEWNQALLDLGPAQHLLIYLYNKAPRSASQFRQYQDLTRRWQGRDRLVGRVGADSALARAYHEIWLCGPAVRDPDLRQRLGEASRALHDHVAGPGAWEAHLS